MQNKSSFKNLTRKRNHPAGISEKVTRIVQIYTLIAQGKYPSVGRLQEKYEVSKRTVHRYIEIINFIDPLELDKERNGYKFINGDRIKKLSLSNDEFLMLLVIGEAISHLGEPLKNEFQKFIDDIAGVKKTPSTKIPMVIKIPDAIQTEELNSYFKSISDCIKEKRSINIEYTALHNKETNERRVDPYGLVFYEGSWILIGYCRLRENIRHFALDMISDLKETNLYFAPKEDFGLDEHLSHSWGIYNKDDVEITVRFSPDVAEYITRKEKWHPSEKRKILPDGSVELTFVVAGVDEIKRWIYHWLPDVEVMEPKWFREQVKKELAISGRRHA